MSNSSAALVTDANESAVNIGTTFTVRIPLHATGNAG